MKLYNTPFGYMFRDETNGKALFMKYRGDHLWKTFNEFYGDDRVAHEHDLTPRMGDDFIEYRPEKINERLEELVIDGMISHEDFFLEKI